MESSLKSDSKMEYKYRDVSEYTVPKLSGSFTVLHEIPTSKSLPQTGIEGVIRSRLQSVVPEYKINIKKKKEFSYQTERFMKMVDAIELNDIVKLKNTLLQGISSADIIDPSSLTTVLHVAAKKGTKETWDVLFSEPEMENWIDTQDIRGTTPIIAASWYDNLSAVEFLLSKNANLLLYIRDTKRTALHCAADLLSSRITETLLSFSGEKNFIDAADFEGNTALMLAVDADSPSVSVLLDAGADYTKKNVVSGRNILQKAIVHNYKPLIEMLVMRYTDNEFLESLDKNGDSPFTLAIRLKNEEAVEILLKSPNLGAILSRSLVSLHTIVDQGMTSVMETLLKIVDDITVFNFIDGKGRTVLMHAIDKGQTQMIDLMLKYGVNYKVRNHTNGETVLHAATYSNDKAILDKILKLNEINEIIHVRDHKGLTAYDIVLRKGGREPWRMFINTGLVDVYYCNKDQESSLFIAAKEGNTFLVQCLLLSDKFNNYFESNTMDLDNEQLVALELQGIIYASDVFICCGYDVGNRGWKLSPEQNHLFKHNIHDQNIFHACALGESVECTYFLHSFCSRFNNMTDDFDRPDQYGNTPFMFVIECGSKSMVNYFITCGVNLAYENKLNQTPLDRLNYNLHYWAPLLSTIIEQCAVHMRDPGKKYLPYGELHVYYNIFCPKGEPQMKVISNIFKRLNGKECVSIFESPIIEYFVMTKWSRIRDLISIRFAMYSLLVVCLSTYLCFFLCVFLKIDHFLVSTLRFVLFFLSILMILFNIPLIFMKRRNLFFLVYIAPLCTLLFLLKNDKSREALELASSGVLFGWLAIVVTGYVTKMSFQIAIFFQILKAALAYLPMCLLLLFAFSNCFFTLFHDFYSFNNPIHSFITTSVFLLHGENALPTFNPHLAPFSVKHNSYQSWNEEKEVLDGGQEMRGLLVEGGILMVFDILVTICVLNMLVGLAVRSGDQLEKEGNIYRIRTYVEEITVWEDFLHSRFYKMISQSRVAYLLGLLPDLKTILEVPTVYRPMSENLEIEFNLQKLRDIGCCTMSKPLAQSLPQFRKLIKQEKCRGSKALRKERKSWTNISWIYT